MYSFSEKGFDTLPSRAWCRVPLSIIFAICFHLASSSRVATPTSSIDDSYTMIIKEEKGKDKKKTKRGQAEAVLMEGSRCSRINGRGWRCAQPTLVGYSLCEHHLGKGRSRGPNIVPCGPLGCTEHKRKESGEGSFHEIVPRRKNKARSISSLLDERNVIS
jgi:WRC